MKHYSEVDLLEMHYSGDRGEAVRHLGDCADCGTRFASLERKLRSARDASCDRVESRPHTFWVRQRMSILRAIESGPREKAPGFPFARLAAAAVLAIALVSGALVVNNTQPVAAPPAVAQTTGPEPSEITLDEIALTGDPWESDELREYQVVVGWQSWEAPDSRGEGTL